MVDLFTAGAAVLGSSVLAKRFNVAKETNTVFAAYQQQVATYNSNLVSYFSHLDSVFLFVKETEGETADPININIDPTKFRELAGRLGVNLVKEDGVVLTDREIMEMHSSSGILDESILRKNKISLGSHYTALQYSSRITAAEQKYDQWIKNSKLIHEANPEYTYESIFNAKPIHSVTGKEATWDELNLSKIYPTRAEMDRAIPDAQVRRGVEYYRNNGGNIDLAGQILGNFQNRAQSTTAIVSVGMKFLGQSERLSRLALAVDFTSPEGFRMGDQYLIANIADEYEKLGGDGQAIFAYITGDEKGEGQLAYGTMTQSILPGLHPSLLGRNLQVRETMELQIYEDMGKYILKNWDNPDKPMPINKPTRKGKSIPFGIKEYFEKRFGITDKKDLTKAMLYNVLLEMSSLDYINSGAGRNAGGIVNYNLASFHMILRVADLDPEIAALKDGAPKPGERFDARRHLAPKIDVENQHGVITLLNSLSAHCSGTTSEAMGACFHSMIDCLNHPQVFSLSRIDTESFPTVPNDFIQIYSDEGVKFNYDFRGKVTSIEALDRTADNQNIVVVHEHRGVETRVSRAQFLDSETERPLIDPQTNSYNPHASTANRKSLISPDGKKLTPQQVELGIRNRFENIHSTPMESGFQATPNQLKNTYLNRIRTALTPDKESLLGAIVNAPQIIEEKIRDSRRTDSNKVARRINEVSNFVNSFENELLDLHRSFPDHEFNIGGMKISVPNAKKLLTAPTLILEAVITEIPNMIWELTKTALSAPVVPYKLANNLTKGVLSYGLGVKNETVNDVVGFVAGLSAQGYAMYKAFPLVMGMFEGEMAKPVLPEATGSVNPQPIGELAKLNNADLQYISADTLLPITRNDTLLVNYVEGKDPKAFIANADSLKLDLKAGSFVRRIRDDIVAVDLIEGKLGLDVKGRKQTFDGGGSSPDIVDVDGVFKVYKGALNDKVLEHIMSDAAANPENYEVDAQVVIPKGRPVNISGCAVIFNEDITLMLKKGDQAYPTISNPGEKDAGYFMGDDVLKFKDSKGVEHQYQIEKLEKLIEPNQKSGSIFPGGAHPVLLGLIEMHRARGEQVAAQIG